MIDKDPLGGLALPVDPRIGLVVVFEVPRYAEPDDVAATTL